MIALWFISSTILSLVVTEEITNSNVPFHYKIYPEETVGETLDENWWKDAVVYQIYPKSFKDSNNDGYGDLQGIISKLEHLKNAGVTVCWLSPIYKSPQVDDGYDISDYRDVDPMFGTLDDFDQLVAKATELGIKVVMDFVPNHTSNEHEWFVLSENKADGYEDYYVWADPNTITGGTPNNWISVFKYSAWAWSDKRQQYYLHQFTEEQPDLNFNSPAVVQEIKDILIFWLDRGVAGFRVDAIPHLFETGLEDEPRSSDTSAASYEYGYLDHIYTKDQPKTFQMVYEWRTLVDDYSKEKGDYSRILMTESATSLENVMLYYGNIETGELGAHFSFNFQLVNSFSSATDVVNTVQSWFNYMPTQYTANWLIGNHDNDRAATRFGAKNVDGYNLLIALLPGVLITYNGEEIGQENGEVSYEECQDPSACGEGEEYFLANSRDFARTPYHWDTSTNAGFNDGAKTWLPVSSKYLETNLADQSITGVSSHFHIYQQVVELRNKKAIVEGDYTIEAATEDILVLTRTLDDGSGYVLVFNVNDESSSVDLSTSLANATSGKIVIASVDSSRSVGDVVDFASIEIAAHEGFVAEIILNESVEELDTDWWKTAVVYQIYPKSFKDSDNDGYGDLQGIISKLDYLSETGVTAVWLSPIHKSPQVDDGYDISDFKDIDPIFGTLDDFDELVAKANEVGIKIIMDLVPNHSSNQHPWFSLSENRAEGYEDYYVWEDANATTGEEPNNWISLFKNSAWKWSEIRQQYYLHQFAVEQPDLNYRSEAVIKEIDDVFTFWLDRGVAGFRIDAISQLFETGLEDEPRSSNEDALPYQYSYLDHIYTQDQPETFEMVYHWRELVDEYSALKGGYSRILMTEAGSSIEKVVKYYGNEETGVLGAHFSFNFHLLGTFTSARDLINSIDYWVSYLPISYTSNWLIGNHDNSRAATRFGPENVDGYNALIALLPGVLVTYNGEEIGQENGEVSYEQCQDPNACDAGEEYFNQYSRDFARTPFQWDNTTNAGFNDGATPWLPVSLKYLQKNLLYQSADGVKSHYHNYQELLQLRHESAIVSGKLKYAAFSDNTLGITRTLTDGFSYVLIFNINDEEETISLVQGFSAISTQLEVVLASVNSSRNVGDIVKADSLIISGHESLVLLEIDANYETTSSSSSSEETTTTFTSTTSSTPQSTTVSSSSSSSSSSTTTTQTPEPSTDASTGGGESTMLASIFLTVSLVIVNVLGINIYY